MVLFNIVRTVSSSLDVVVKHLLFITSNGPIENLIDFVAIQQSLADRNTIHYRNSANVTVGLDDIHYFIDIFHN